MQNFEFYENVLNPAKGRNLEVDNNCLQSKQLKSLTTKEGASSNKLLRAVVKKKLKKPQNFDYILQKQERVLFFKNFKKELKCLVLRLSKSSEISEEVCVVLDIKRLLYKKDAFYKHSDLFCAQLETPALGKLVLEKTLLDEIESKLLQEEEQYNQLIKQLEQKLKNHSWVAAISVHLYEFFTGNFYFQFAKESHLMARELVGYTRNIGHTNKFAALMTLLCFGYFDLYNTSNIWLMSNVATNSLTRIILPRVETMMTFCKVVGCDESLAIKGEPLFRWFFGWGINCAVASLLVGFGWELLALVSGGYFAATSMKKIFQLAASYLVGKKNSGLGRASGFVGYILGHRLFAWYGAPKLATFFSSVPPPDKLLENKEFCLAHKDACLNVALTHLSELTGKRVNELDKMSNPEIGSLYRRNIGKLHPDKGGNYNAFLKQQQAYEALKLIKF